MKLRPTQEEHQMVLDAVVKGGVVHAAVGMCHHSIQANLRAGKMVHPPYVLSWRHDDGSGGSIPCSFMWFAEELKQLLLKAGMADR